MPPSTESARGQTDIRRLPTLLACFATVLFLRLWLVREWGSGIPYWDQWDAEALLLYKPWLDGTWRWADLFRAHNEHRIVLTRLIDLALFVATGRWETWWQLVINAVLNAALATLIFGAFWDYLRRGFRIVFLAAIIWFFTTPSGCQNALWGFQSSGYLVNGLSGLAVFALATAPLNKTWWFGWGAALLAVFAQGSGVFAAVVALVILAHSAVRTPNRWRAGIAGLLLAALIALGFSLGVKVPGHSYLRADSPQLFLSVFTRCLAYPLISHPFFCVPLQLPALWLLVIAYRERRNLRRHEALALALCLLGVLNAAAIAYSRGAGLVDHLPVSRYQDALLLGAVGNTAALLGICVHHRRGGAIAAVWAGGLALGLSLLGFGSLTLNLPFKVRVDHISVAMIAAYRETRNPLVFEIVSPYLRPHPAPRSVVAVLDDPKLDAILPPEAHGRPARVPWPVTASPWLAILASTILAALVFVGRRQQPTTGIERASPPLP